jgi:hypothetical protein
MTPKGNWMELSVISALFILLALWGMVWDFTSGLLTSGVDGIMLFLVCALTVAVFAIQLLLLLNGAGMLPALGRSKSKAAASVAEASAPAADEQSSSQGK